MGRLRVVAILLSVFVDGVLLSFTAIVGLCVPNLCDILVAANKVEIWSSVVHSLRSANEYFREVLALFCGVL